MSAPADASGVTGERRLDARAERIVLWSLLAGNFVIGSGVLLPAGLLNQLTEAFGVTVTTAGSLVGYGALMLFVAAPLSALVTNRIDRRVLLAGALALYAVGHLASALVTDFTALLLIRVAMMLGAAIFTPQAASALGQFIAPARRGAAVAFIFMGWSVAAATGVPAATLLGAAFGWHSAYVFLAIASAVATLAVWMTMPHGLRVPPLSLHDWRTLLMSPAILLVLAVTTLSIGGMFTLYPFVAAQLKSQAGLGSNLIAAVLGLYGVAGIVGAALSTRVIDKLGAARALRLCLVSVIAGLLLWHAGSPSFALLALGIFIWGLGFGPSVSAQQARLIAAAPALSSASIALNSSLLYAGQALGSSVGGQMIARGHARELGLVGAGFVLVSLGVSELVLRRMKT